MDGEEERWGLLGPRRVRASVRGNCPVLKMSLTHMGLTPGWEESWLKRRPKSKEETGSPLGGSAPRAVPMDE